MAAQDMVAKRIAWHSRGKTRIGTVGHAMVDALVERQKRQSATAKAMARVAKAGK